MDTYRKIIFADSAGNSRAPMAAELLKECKIKLPIDVQARGIVVLFPEPLNQKAGQHRSGLAHILDFWTAKLTACLLLIRKIQEIRELRVKICVGGMTDIIL